MHLKGPPRNFKFPPNHINLLKFQRGEHSTDLLSNFLHIQTISKIEQALKLVLFYVVFVVMR